MKKNGVCALALMLAVAGLSYVNAANDDEIEKAVAEAMESLDEYMLAFNSPRGSF